MPDILQRRSGRTDPRIGAGAPTVPTRKTSEPRGSSGPPEPTEPPAIPVRIIQGGSEAEDAKAREAKSDQHDANDLEAQVRAADAAESQVWAAWGSVGLTTVATLLLVWTLWETRKTAKAAIEANKVARTTAYHRLRAYVMPTSAFVTQLEPGKVVSVVVNIKNFRQTPAYRTVSLVYVTVAATDLIADISLGLPQVITEFADIAPGHEFGMDEDSISYLLSQEDHEQIKKGAFLSM